MNKYSARDGGMSPTQLRKLADDIENGRADASYHITIDHEIERPMIGEGYDARSGRRYATRQFKDSKIVIEVQCWSDVEVQHPVTGEWIVLDSTR